MIAALMLLAGVAPVLGSWMGQDIGPVGVTGNFSYNSATGTYTVNGAGTGMGGGADSFHFVSSSSDGDCEITAHVDSLGSQSPYSFAGLMIRESTDPMAKNAFISVSSAHGIKFSVRKNTAGNTIKSLGTSQAAPAWLRLLKVGSTVVGYTSNDGASWTMIGWETVEMSNKYFAGMAVSSTVSNVTTSAEISRVSVVNNLPYAIDSLNLWLRADMDVSQNAGKVSLWLDESDNGNDAKQVLTSSQPDWVDNQLNGKPVLRFDGSNDFMSVADTFGLKPLKLSVYVVGRYQNSSGTPFFLVKSNNYLTDGYGLYSSAGQTALFVNNSSLQSNVIATSLALNTWAVISGCYDLQQLSIGINGRPSVDKYLSTQIFHNPASLDVGGRQGTGLLNGDIAEILIFNRSLTAFEQMQLHAYFYQKYGVGSLPVADTPVISVESPAPGLYSTAVAVSLQRAIGSDISYTLDNSDPTTSTTAMIYNGTPITISVSSKLRIVAKKTGYANSPETVASYVIDVGTEEVPRAGMKLWLRGDLGVTSNGSSVSAWGDQSGSGNNALQGNGGNQPTVQSGVLNGKPVIRFDGTDDNLSIADNVGLSPATLTAYVVGKYQTGGASTYGVFLLKSNPSQWTSFGMFRDGGNLKWSINMWNTNYVSSTQSADTWMVMKGSYDLSKLKLKVNGGTSVEGNYTSAINYTGDALYLGSGPGGSPLKGEIAEVLLYDHALTESEAGNVETYFYERYGVGSLPTPEAPVLTSSTVFSDNQTVSISTEVAQSTIRYTLDGSDPTGTSEVYDSNNPPVLRGSATVKARVYREGFPAGVVATASYVKDPLTAFNRSGLKIWLRTDVGMELNGNGVAKWSDLSGNGNDANQTNAASQPTLTASQIGGRAVVCFDGTNDLLTIADSATTRPDKMTAILVMKPNVGGDTNWGVFFKKGGWYDGYGITRLYGPWGFFVNSCTTTASTTNEQTRFMVVEGVYDRITEKLYIDRTMAANTAQTEAIIHNTNPIGIGAQYNGNYFTAMDVAEIMLFNDVLSDGEKQKVQSYLSQRYDHDPSNPAFNLAPYSIALSTGSGPFAAPTDVTLSANVSNATSAIHRVDFYQGSYLVGSDTEAPFSQTLADLAPGNYKYKAVSLDSAGKRATATVNFQVSLPGGEIDPNRFIRGTGIDPTFQSYVIALDDQKGFQPDPMGNNASAFPSGLPWFMRVAKYTAYHLANTGGTIAYNIPFENPLVAFGSQGGGSPLYTNQSYSFGVGTGGQLFADSTLGDVRIEIYQKSDFSGGDETNVEPVEGKTRMVHLPRIGTSEWDTFAQHGYVHEERITDVINGKTVDLVTTIQYVAAGVPSSQWGQDPLLYANFRGAPLLITHKSSSTDFVYKVSFIGRTVDSGDVAHWLAAENPTYPDYTGTYNVSYTLDFSAPQGWRSTYLDRPHFQGQPLPSAYLGKSLEELIHDAPQVEDTLAAPDSTYGVVDDSPELRSHPILDQFVADMGNDPLALANYVVNEIELTDAMGYSDSGTVDETAINPTGVGRGALATYLEGQGSPTEQCALLVYLLRKSGVRCGYVFPSHNGMLLFDQQLSHLLRMQLRGAQDELGNSSVPTLIPVNYPWVTAYIGNKWVHIFPWLKDTAIEEGYDVFDYMPSGYQTGLQWMRHYVEKDPTIRALSAEVDNAGALFPMYVTDRLKANQPGLSIDDMGVKIYNRRHYYSDWNDFPRPWQTPAISGSNLKVNLNTIANIFDTMNVKVFSDRNGNGTADSGEPIINAGDLRMVDLHNRRFLLYTVKTGADAHTIILSLDSFRPSATSTYTFNDASLLNRQFGMANLTSQDDNLRFQIDYKRHRQLSASFFPPNHSLPDYYVPFLGFHESTSITDSRPLRKGDMAAFCLNYGRVTEKMMEVHAGKFWAYQKQQSQSTGTVDSEITAGLPLYLMGLSYYHMIGKGSDAIEKLTKSRIVSTTAHGFAKLSPQRNANGTLPNNGDINLKYPRLDMSFLLTATASNTTLHPDSGDSPFLPQQNLMALMIADGSALEHRAINEYYGQDCAISTIKLLDIAQGSTPGSGFVELTKANYASLGSGNYTCNGTTHTLEQWASPPNSNLWASITGALNNSASGPFTTVYITPGPVQAPGQSYRGIGALIIGQNSFSALITDNMGSDNGGYGGSLNYSVPVSNVSASYLSNSVLSSSPFGSYSFKNIASYSQPVSLPPVVSSSSFPSTFNSLSSGVYKPTFDVESYINQAVQTIKFTASGGGDTAFAQKFQAVANAGYGGVTADNRSLFGTFGKAVLDPVNSVTGEFYVDAVDLRLNGPMPLEIRRNYGSLNLANNNFGYGWRLACFPYLVLSTDNDTIYAAEMDGSVIAYTKQTSGEMAGKWIPTVAANPHLANMNNDKPGSLGNVFNNFIEKTGNDADDSSIYTLKGADGSIRTYDMQRFPVPGTSADNGLTRQRPYLQKWQDNRGNYFNFTFGTDPNSVDYGELRRITASNGNFVGFYYDTGGHITEAYTGDGQRLYYGYDEYGDLVEVMLPDGTAIGYDYSHKPNPSGQPAGTYSEHLITRERKPQGRILENVYDSGRRVIVQRATVGENTVPVQNAGFVYQNTTNTDGTITGFTTITDVNNQQTRYDYTNSQITGITDAIGQQIAQTWYQPGDPDSGAYPRSLKRRTDKRGLQADYTYDNLGNLDHLVTTGNLTGNGTSETATTDYDYNGLNAVTQVTDPVGRITKYLYEDSAHPYQPTRVESRTGSGLISTTLFEYEDVGTGVPLAKGLLKKQTIAEGTADQAATTFTNNANGFVTKITRSTGTSDPVVTTNCAYNWRGELDSETDEAGRTTKYAYDGRGNPIWTERRDENGTLVSWQYNYYNQNGEIEWTQGPRYYPDDYVLKRYDGAGRIKEELKWRSEAKADGSGVQAVADPATTFYVHDAFGNLKEVTDPRHNTTTMSYDFIGQMLGRIMHNGDKNGAALATEAFSYEPGGEIWQHTGVLGGVTTNLYTSTGKLRQQTMPDGSVLQWTYDLGGRVVRESLGNGSYWQTDYDDLNRTVTRTFKSASGAILGTEVVIFDRRGNVISRKDLEDHVSTTEYDALNRVKVQTGPAASGSSTQQRVTHSYDAAGRTHVATDVLGRTTTTTRDALLRPTQVMVSNADGSIVSVVGHWYSPDHQSVTTTRGVGEGSVTTVEHTDTFGQPVLSINGDGTFRKSTYDANGNLIASTDELGRVTSSSFDALDHLDIQKLPGGAEIDFDCDAAGNVLQRKMPGGINKQSTFDSAGRKTAEELDGGTSGVTQNFSYAYYTSGEPVGLLHTVTDPRGFVTTTEYDGFLRPHTVTTAGSSTAEQNQTTVYEYDRRSLLTDITQSYANGATGPSTIVHRDYDAYGRIAGEAVSIGGTTVANWEQKWDGAGNRSSLDSLLETQGSGVGGQFGFQYDAAGSLTNVAAGGRNYSFAFGNNLLLQRRSSPWRTQFIDQRDSRGRMLSVRNSAGRPVPITPLSETLGWLDDSRMGSYTAERQTAGIASETRNYGYDVRGRLLSEPYVAQGGTARSTSYQFDGNTESGAGVRTLVSVNATTGYIANSQNAFLQVTQDTDKPGDGSTVTVGSSFDAGGYVTTRTVGSATQTLTWDSFGRLVKVSQRDGSNNGFDWRAAYDGLGRRLRTVQQPVSGGSASGSALTLDSYFDPQVEFLEIGVAVNGARTWKVYGPDLNGVYGGLQGIGGLEAAIDESSGTTVGALSDAFGNVVGSLNGSTITWNPAAVGGYGVLPGSSAQVVDGSHGLMQAISWRGHYIDPTGFYNLGARHYDPKSGRFLSPDPMGHAASMSLYDYASGDPINNLDPDGRFGKQVALPLVLGGVRSGLGMASSIIEDSSPGSVPIEWRNTDTGQNYYPRTDSFLKSYDKYVGSEISGNANYKTGQDAIYVLPLLGLKTGMQPKPIAENPAFVIDGDVIKFDASRARLGSAPSRGSGYGTSPETLATVDSSGQVVVFEGKHRVNLTLEGETFAESVPGQPGWLEYQFEPGLPTPPGVPAGTWVPPLNKTPPLLNPSNPWEGLDGY
ncbi:MAG: RHS repeat-associated core domain-containing protein [Phycisphaerae bacterium]|jgi:RHS repeat-associated protein